MDTKPTTIDEYLAPLPHEMRAPMQDLRERIQALAPEATEAISYAIPAFKYRGKTLIQFGAAKNHYAIYGTVAGSTIRFAPGERPTDEFLKTIVEDRLASVEAALAKPKKRTTTSA